MDFREDIEAVYEGGVFKPDRDPGMPEHTRVRLSVRPAKVDPAAREHFFKVLEEVQRNKWVRTAGWRFDREKLYDRGFI